MPISSIGQVNPQASTSMQQSKAPEFDTGNRQQQPAQDYKVEISSEGRQLSRNMPQSGTEKTVGLPDMTKASRYNQSDKSSQKNAVSQENAITQQSRPGPDLDNLTGNSQSELSAPPKPGLGGMSNV